jgi:hypothetical protein
VTPWVLSLAKRKEGRKEEKKRKRGKEGRKEGKKGEKTKQQNFRDSDLH